MASICFLEPLPPSSSSFSASISKLINRSEGSKQITDGDKMNEVDHDERLNKNVIMKLGLMQY